MSYRTYYCGRCDRNHRYDSQIGREHAHLGASVPLARRPSFPTRPAQPSQPRPSARPTPVSRPPRAPGQGKPSTSGQHVVSRPNVRPPLPDQRRQRYQDPRERAFRRVAGDNVSDAIVTLLFDPTSSYWLLADKLLDEVPWYRWKNRRHWLCTLLDRASEAIDPGTYARVLGKDLARLLEQSGLPRFAAQVIAKSSAFGAGKALHAASGLAHVQLGLRLLIPLVCPNFDNCPAQVTSCKTLLEPGVEDLLRSAVPPVR